MKKEVFLKIRRMIKRDKKLVIKRKLKSLYPADLVELINELSKDEIGVIINSIPLKNLALELTELNFESKQVLLNLLQPEGLRIILDSMAADDLADLLGSLSIGKSKELLDLMKKEDAKKIQNLLGYDEESAGGIMTTEYIAIRETKTVQEALDKIRDIATKAEMIYYIYIVNQTNQLVGVLSMRELITTNPGQQIKKIMHEKIIDVKVDVDQEEVAKYISKYDLLAIPVVNYNEQLLGIITVDDIIDVIEEEATEDIYKMAATTEIDLDSRKNMIMGAALKRLPWLTVLLFASMLSGTVIDIFSTTISSVVALTFFMPTLSGTGGNAATQALAIVVRGLATGDVDSEDIFEHLFNEIKIGILVAVTCGLIIGVVALIWQGNVVLGLVVGLAMMCSILTATIVGTTVPFIVNKVGIDPAVAAGPFITTVIDASSLFIYFSLAKLFLYYLT